MDTTEFKTFSDVRAEQKGNPANRWFRPGADAEDESGYFAFQRLGAEFFKAYIQPKFRVQRSSSFFMMGSCFARGLESALSAQGLLVKSLSKRFDDLVAVEGSRPIGVANRYNTGSILNEFRWALDPGNPFPDAALIDLSDGNAIDPHMNAALGLTNRDETMMRRGMFGEITAEIAHADVVVLTLGLLEVWFDNKLGLVMNVAPTMPMVRAEPDRFVFGRLRHADNLRNLNEIHSLLQRYAKPGYKVIITVSPVPLGLTFTNDDVVAANTYSKSVLRAVATDFAEEHDNVDYFPSYEIVMNSKFDTSWIHDKRHPQGKLGGHIMRTFVANYVEGVDADKISLKEQYVV